MACSPQAKTGVTSSLLEILRIHCTRGSAVQPLIQHGMGISYAWSQSTDMPVWAGTVLREPPDVW